MKPTLLLTAALAAVLASPSLLQAQSRPGTTPAPVIDTAAATAGTQVTSDNFRLNLGQREGIFSGNVRVADAVFELESEEMTVYFAEDNSVQRLVARGNVRIKQGETRSTTSREAEYLIAEKKLILKGEPVVLEGETRVTGTVINIFPEADRMEVEGRSRVNLILN